MAGDFLGFLQRVAPSFTLGVHTPGLAVAVNELMVVGLVVAALIGPAVPSVALSGAALVAVNGLGHLAAAVRTCGYAPGVVTGGWCPCRSRWPPSRPLGWPAG
jgi:hypothetical protein